MLKRLTIVLVSIAAVVFVPYWLGMAVDRYVSHSIMDGPYWLLGLTVILALSFIYITVSKILIPVVRWIIKGG